MAFVYKVKADHNVFFGVAARAGPGNGSKANLAYSAALWADIDEEDAAERLRSSGLPEPSIVVASGSKGHLQAYWLLEEPYQLRDPDPIAVFESHLRGIVRVAGGDKACIDATRVLRLPNSRNFKHSPPTYVDVLAWHPEHRYKLADFPQGEVVSVGQVDLGDAVEPKRPVQTGWVRDVLEHGYEGQWNPDKSCVDFKVACGLLDEGFPPAQVLWLCTDSPAIGKRKPNWQQYWRRTIANALKRI
jgi:hypothetical protein